MKGITDIKVDAIDTRGKAAVCWSDGIARYHVWAYVDHLGVLAAGPVGMYDSTIYKNPPAGTKCHTPGYFHTRQLDVMSAKNRPIVEHVFREVLRLGLVKAAREQQAAEIAAEEARHKARVREHRIAKAAPDLLVALKALLDEPRSAHVRRVARAVIEKAEAEVQS